LEKNLLPEVFQVLGGSQISPVLRKIGIVVILLLVVVVLKIIKENTNIANVWYKFLLLYLLFFLFFFFVYWKHSTNELLAERERRCLLQKPAFSSSLSGI